MDKLRRVEECPECGGRLLAWDRLPWQDVLLLACEECSKTIQYLGLDEVAEYLNDLGV